MSESRGVDGTRVTVKRVIRLERAVWDPDTGLEHRVRVLGTRQNWILGLAVATAFSSVMGSIALWGFVVTHILH